MLSLIYRKTVWLLLLYPALMYAGDGVKDALTQQYKKHVIALRTPFVPGDQEFDSAGKPLKSPKSGKWLEFGGIYIDDLDLSSNTLRLEGRRVAFTGEQAKAGRPIAVPLGKSFAIKIHLDHPLTSSDEAQALLDRVFYLNDKDLTHARPEYRAPENAAGGNGGTGSVYKFGDPGVKPPEPIHTPDPDYTDEARRGNYQGNVVLYAIVDKNGAISRIRIVRGLGHGLDENAVDAVKTWRFKPGTRDGQPVAMGMNVEVSFRLAR